MIDIHEMPDTQALGQAAARRGADNINAAIAARGAARIVVATGVSQFEVLTALVTLDVDWSRVTAFHLDEYVGMPATHPASFRRYLRERFADQVPTLGAMHYIAGDAPDLDAEITRLGRLIKASPIDLIFAGIGENGHLAFNDPPADFDTEVPYLLVDLDERCRMQQLGEGWFAALEDVPHQAISMSIHQIMQARCLVVSAPDARKAEAVRNTLEAPISPLVPASILRRHPDCHLYLDPAAAAGLTSARPGA